MEFLDERVKVICEELKRLKVKQVFPLLSWEYKEGDYIYPQDAENDSQPWKGFDCKTMHWYGKDRHYWFRTTYTVPESLDGKPMWIRVSSQIDEWDDGRNPQFLLFVNGEILQGIDMNHRECLITRSANAGDVLTIELQSYTGILHEEFALRTQIEEIDPQIEELYYDLWVPLAAFSRMEKDDKTRRDIENILNNTINYLDLRTPYSTAFYDSVENAERYIKKALYEDFTGYDDVIATCIGHTHIDVAWYWTVAQTREKVGRSFATVLKLMEEYPNYRFMSSQPPLYIFLKERYPELYEKARARIAEKRWEPEGAMWVEADTNLTSGESLVRQFVHGKRFFKEEFGVDSKVLWLPDVFGYTGALPQIMKKCGIDYFMTTKLAWNQFNKVPYDTMMWRGIDGSEVFTHLITTLSVAQPVSKYFTTYNGMLHPDSIMGGWMRYQNKDINNDILVSFGYGDGGGGPTREMLETSKRMEKGIKGIPKVRQEFSKVYFDELYEKVKDSRRLPTWEGEFYFEYHRGTLTSMARNKRANRKCELGLMDAELLSVLANDRIAYPKNELTGMWNTVLLNQFHDILPGSSIREVYDVTKEEYDEISEKLAEITADRMKLLTGSGNGITLFNTTGRTRDDIVNLGKTDAETLRDENGNIFPIQHTADGDICYVRGLPSKGYRTFTADSEAHPANRRMLLHNDRCIETPFYIVEFNENGHMSRIYDKENDREVLKEGQYGNLMRMYEDKPMFYDNWDIDIYYTEKYWDLNSLDSMEWTEFGDVVATLKIRRKESNSLIVQDINFYADSPKIEFRTYVDWKENQTLLKVHFPVDVHTDEATFDIQFGNLKRKVHTNTSWDMARFESCGQKWIDLSEGHYGVSVLNDCKYGHSVKDGNIGLTLIKCGNEPNPVADREEHYFTYALYPHAGTWQEADTVAKAYELNQPVLVCCGGNTGDSFSFASADKRNVILETVKQEENGDGIILRMYESENALTKVNLSVADRFTKAYLCNLLEEEEQEIPVDNGSISLRIKPYEIITVKLK
ncbi:MAG: alpha-mannosidase [Bacillota bacterium]|nr:alpha-mannosidase [Bacillota bacterium]